MRIQHNIMAMNAYRNYTNNVAAMKKNLEKLSSGYKINRAGDDAAGLAISEKMRAQITGLETAQKNAKDGISLVQTAEGALTEVHDMLNRMVELATQSANGTYDNTTDRYQLQKEMDQLRSEINRIADSANFNGIKLLDGKSLAGDLTELGVNYDTVSTVKGLTIGDVKDGGGTNGQFTIDIAKMFSAGDTIAIDIDGATAGTFTFNEGSGVATDFGGKTAAEQAASLAGKLGVHGTIGAKFNVSVDGSKITLTAKEEGVDASVVSGITTTNNATSYLGAITDTAAAETNGTANVSALEVIGGTAAAGSGNIEEGDILTFEFTSGHGEVLKAQITATAEMADSNAANATKAIVDALKETYFQDNADTTGLDESQLQVKDLFTLDANQDKAGTANTNGTIKVTANNAGTTLAKVNSFTIDHNGAKKTYNSIEGTAGGANSATAASKKVETASAVNYTAGDKVKVTGTLADGRTFETILEAGKDFEIDNTTRNNTVTNLAAAFASKDVTVTLKDKNGNDAGTITGEDLFGAKGEFTASATGGALTIQAKKAGLATTHNSSTVDSITAIPLDAVDTKLTKNLATPQTAAQSTIKLDNTLGYGAAVKVGDKTYEIVADARDTSNRSNEAVVVADPTDSKAVAKALAEAIAKNETNYNVTASNDGTVTIESKDIGSTQKALSVTTPYGDKVTTATFKFSPKAVKEGSVLTFNGDKYQFVKKGGTAEDGATAIEVEDFSKATAKSLGDAFANVQKSGVVSVANDGTVTLKGTEVDGVISNPTIAFANSLRLQIGDTADSYNQLEVNLSDMHTKAMGIADISIADQDSAAVAVDVIKSAINYVSDVRGTLGATQNRLDHTINNLSVMTENIQDAESTIRDTDVAAEMMAYTKNNILIQSAQAMLAQANQVPQGVLQLLQ